MTTLEPIACSTDDNSRMNNQLADHPTRRSSSSAATGSPKNKKKSASLPQETVEYLKNWMMSPEHITHPYPTEQEKAHIMKETGIELKQLTNWFVNNRKRYWKPRVEARLQKQAKAHAGPAIIPGATPLGKTKRSAPVTPPRQQSLVHVVSTHNVVSLTEEQNVERSTEGDRRSGAGSRSGSIVSCTASESESVGIYYEHDDISTNQTTDEPFVCMERGCVSVDAGAPKAVGAVDVSASVKNIGDDLLQTHIGCEILSSILKKEANDHGTEVKNTLTNNLKLENSKEDISVHGSKRKNKSVFGEVAPRPKYRRKSFKVWKKACEDANHGYCATLPTLDEAARLFGYAG